MSVHIYSMFPLTRGSACDIEALMGEFSFLLVTTMSPNHFPRDVKSNKHAQAKNQRGCA